MLFAGLVFVSMVTAERRPLLLSNPDLFFECWDGHRPEAWILAPDHVHMLLRPGSDSVASIVHQFIRRYGWYFRELFGRSNVWPDRYWEHLIRDDQDLAHHLDYIHFNPVRHGLSRSPWQYRYSSFALYVSRGRYDLDWSEDVAVVGRDYGE